MISAAAQIQTDLVVSNFITDAQWDIQKLNDIYHPFSVECIMNINIPAAGDVTGSSTNTVATRYLVEVGYYTPPVHQSTRENSEWNALIWNLKLPPKVKIFLWRSMKDCLPAEMNLKQHHVPTSEF